MMLHKNLLSKYFCKNLKKRQFIVLVICYLLNRFDADVSDAVYFEKSFSYRGSDFLFIWSVFIGSFLPNDRSVWIEIPSVGICRQPFTWI